MFGVDEKFMELKELSGGKNEQCTATDWKKKVRGGNFPCETASWVHLRLFSGFGLVDADRNDFQ